MEMNDTKAIALRIEMYARENIPEQQNEYGQFMYHAELINRGHWAIHQSDLQDMPEPYKDIIRSLYFEASKDPLISTLKNWEY
jgi:hypothetical protein